MHVIVIWFDRLPYSLLGCCGNSDIATPAFDQLAGSGVVFDNCLSTDGFDGAANRMASTLAGLSASGCAVKVIATEETLLLRRILAESAPLDALEMLADTAALEDYATSVNSAQPLVTLFTLPGVPLTVTGLRSDMVLEATRKSDEAVSHILAALERDDAMADRVILVCAESGLPLAGENHSPVDSLREQSIHVPLLGRHGHTFRLGVRCSMLVTARDVCQTIRELVGQEEAPAGTQTLTPVLRGEEPTGRDTLLVSGSEGLVGVRTCDWYLITPQARESVDPEEPSELPLLFQKPNDIWDQLDVASQFPDAADRLAAAWETK